VTDEQLALERSVAGRHNAMYEQENIRDLRNKSFEQTIDQRIKYECFMAYCYPNTAHGKMLLTWRD
jgi:hypothetical protein